MPDETETEEATEEEGPITVPYEEPSAEDQERMRHQAELSDLISSVCAGLAHHVSVVQHTASIAAAAPDSTTAGEIGGLAGDCSGLAGNAHGAAAQLLGAGVEDWVYSVKACNEVAYWANSAAGHASAAANSEYPTEIKMSLDQVVHDLGNAAHSINQA